MRLIETPTPAYKQQRDEPAVEPRTGILGWLGSLLRTPTPAYKTLPPQTARQPEPDNPEADSRDR